MRLYLVAGEASGDARGAELMRALREQAPGVEFFGAGGLQMKALAGGDFFDWAHEAVVGLWDVLKKYGYFRAQFDRMLDEIDRLKPDALVLIDYPGFNHRLAKAARVRRPGMKIIDYISPQVWAWNRGRIPKMARYLDLMLCIFPFEKPLYEASGLPTEFVGHPMLDSLAAKKINASREPNLIGLFPGSREKEVRKILPVMLEAASKMQRRQPDLHFVVAAASPALAEMAEKMVFGTSEAGANLQCTVATGQTHELMQRVAAGMVCSGTATLESAYFGLPMVILYKVAWLTWEVGKRLVKVPFLGMPNVLAGREIAREFLQDAARPDQIADAVLALVNDAEKRTAQQRELAAVIAQLGEPGAGVRAAQCILRTLSPRS